MIDIQALRAQAERGQEQVGLRPEQLQVVLIDPKLVEMALFRGIPHLRQEIITTPEQALRALQDLVFEMEQRYVRFEQEGVTNILSYNRKHPTQRLPYIVTVVDELADLMLSGGRKHTEGAIQRLAQKGRACGIHLVVATQRPSVDVITGTIKAVIPAPGGLQRGLPHHPGLRRRRAPAGPGRPLLPPGQRGDARPGRRRAGRDGGAGGGVVGPRQVVLGVEERRPLLAVLRGVPAGEVHVASVEDPRNQGLLEDVRNIERRVHGVLARRAADPEEARRLLAEIDVLIDRALDGANPEAFANLVARSRLLLRVL